MAARASPPRPDTPGQAELMPLARTKRRSAARLSKTPPLQNPDAQPDLFAPRPEAPPPPPPPYGRDDLTPIPLALWAAIAAERAGAQDQFLYLLFDQADPEGFETAALMERGALAMRLRSLAEDEAPTDTGSLSCFRLRRYLVGELVEDTDTSARLGAPCFYQPIF